jgi:signal transduction histidine kinase/ActR/RegA family two-component response regulator
MFAKLPGESKLQRIERCNLWMWVLAALLLVSLGAAVATVYLSQITEATASPFPAPETRGLLAGGLCGILALFCLYAILKQREMQRLRSQLYVTGLREESLRSRLFGLASLLEGIASLGAQVDLEAVLQTLAEHVRDALRADQSSLMLLHAESQELRCRAVAGLDREFVRGASVKLGEGIAGWVAAHNEARVLHQNDVRSVPGATAKPGRSIHTAMCVPLAVRDRVIGVLNINRLEQGPLFTEDDARLVTVFAAHAAIAIDHILERANDERTQRAQKLEALGRLAGGVAHDFNNLLTVVLGHLERVLDGLGAGHPLRSGAEKARDGAERCALLTRQLLAFGSKHVVRPQPLDLNADVAAMADLLRRVIPENISLVTRLDPDLGWISADPGQIEQVILNLTLNARDAMPEGGTLTIATANADVEPGEVSGRPPVAPGSYVTLRVSDTGTGVDPEIVERVFEPFFSTKGQERGTGLGLATVYAVVKQSGGEISLRSEPGAGTTFLLWLPRVAAAPRPAPAAPASVATPACPARVLLVEDEDAVRELTREILELGGYTVIEARNGHEALAREAACAETIDLLLTDVVMPRMSGHEVVVRLSPRRPHMRIMYMSGYTGDALDRLALANPTLTFLQKPFTPQGLLLKVQHALAGPPPSAARSEPTAAAA